jgi:predicted methyltransferase
MPKYDAMLRHIRESLKPGGRLVILDNRPNRTAQRPREKQTNNHVLSVDLAAAEITAAGFRIEARDDGFLDNPDSEAAHWLIVAQAL